MGAVGKGLMEAFGIGQGPGMAEMRGDLTSAQAMSGLDFLRDKNAGDKLGKLVNTANYAPITGVADAAARQVRGQLADMISRQASAAPGGYDPSAQRGAMNAAARSSAQVGGQQIMGNLQEQMMNRQLGQGLDQIKLGLQQQKADTYLKSGQAMAGLAQQQQGQQSAFGNQLLGGALNVGGLIGKGLLASDERVKKDVKPGDAKIERAMDAIQPVSYRYKSVDGFDIGYRPDPENSQYLQIKAPVGVHGDSPEFRQAVASAFPGMHAGVVQEQPAASDMNAGDLRDRMAALPLEQGTIERPRRQEDPRERVSRRFATYGPTGTGMLSPQGRQLGERTVDGPMVALHTDAPANGAPLDAISSYPNLGVTAQNVQSAGVGGLVRTDPATGVKGIDVPQATGFNMAAVANLHQRLRDLEGGNAKLRRGYMKSERKRK